MAWELDPSGTEVLFRALEAVPAGAEVFNSYGQDKSNTSLLFNYGFCLPDAPSIVECSLKSRDPASGDIVVVWEGCFHGNETTLHQGLLDQFADEEAEDGGQASSNGATAAAGVPAEAWEFMLQWLKSSMLGPHEASRVADDAILSGAVAVHDPRRRWVALYAAGQRRVLEHVAGLMQAGLAAAEGKEATKDESNSHTVLTT